jgi:nitronate monooxygenase
MLKARPTIVSSIMGVYSPEFVRQLKQEGIAYFATVTTVEEAKIAEASGADAVVAQGMDRGAFNAADAEQRLVGLFSLLPAVVDAVEVPVVAAGGIADGRGIAAAIILGASAVQIGTGFLRCPEAGISIAWADELAHTLPEETRISRVFSGRPARGIETAYVRAATEPEAPKPAPYPVQRALTAPMRSAAARENDIDRMQAWAGQSAALARALPASELIKVLWEEARSALRQNI